MGGMSAETIDIGPYLGNTMHTVRADAARTPPNKFGTDMKRLCIACTDAIWLRVVLNGRHGRYALTL